MVFHGFPTVFPGAQLRPARLPRCSWDRHGNRSAGSPVAAGFPWGFHHKNHGKTMGKHRKTMGKPWENHGKTMENHGKTMGKPWENHRKTMGKHRKTMGKPWENHGKTMENHGKPWENHGKMWIEPAKIGETLGFSLDFT